MMVLLKSMIELPIAVLLLLMTGVVAAQADDAQPDAGGDHAAETAQDHADGDLTANHASDEHDQHTATHGVGHIDYNKPPITPDRSMLELFLFSLVLFWVFLIVARKMAWLPLVEGLNARESRVNRALADAEAARIAAAKILDDHQAQLNEVTEQVKGIIAEARTAAEQEKARIIAEAEAETSAMRDQAIAEIHAAHEESLSGLDERIESQVGTATRHVLG